MEDSSSQKSQQPIPALQEHEVQERPSRRVAVKIQPFALNEPGNGILRRSTTFEAFQSDVWTAFDRSDTDGSGTICRKVLK